MKVLLDKCVDQSFVELLPGHAAEHVLQYGWENLGNGHLLDAAESAGFEVLLTVDKNMRFQQNLTNRRICLVVHDVPKIDIDNLMPFSSAILRLLDVGLTPGTGRLSPAQT
jgi:hypothetical protein